MTGDKCYKCGGRGQLTPTEREGIRSAKRYIPEWSERWCWACWYREVHEHNLFEKARDDYPLTAWRAMNPPPPIRADEEAWDAWHDALKANREASLRTKSRYNDTAHMRVVRSANNVAPKRARRGATVEQVPIAGLMAKLAEHGYRCALTGESGELGLDHIVPYSQGGGHTLENLRWANKRANTARGVTIVNEARLPPEEGPAEIVVRISGDADVLRWFQGLSTKDRGRALESLRE